MHRFNTAGRSRLRRHLSAVAVTAIAGSAVFSGSAMADVSEVSGSAFGTSVDVTTLLGANVTSPPTAPVGFTAVQGQNPPANLGPFTGNVLSVTVPNLVGAGVINTRTEGGNLEGDNHAGFATSRASVADVDALAGRVTAAVVASECTSNGDGSSGSSTLTSASVLGLPVAVNPAPNTVIPLPGIGSITLNEQIRPTDGAGDTSIIVRAIHIRLDGILGNGDIIIAESRCGARGPDVVPVAPIGLLGLTALLGIGFAGMQWKNRRDSRSAAVSTH